MKIPLIALTLATASASFAQILYNDTNGTASGQGSAATVNWDDAVWSTSLAGTTEPTTWTQGGAAVFNGTSPSLTISLGTSDVQAYEIGNVTQSVNITSTGGKITHNDTLILRSFTNALNISADIDVGSSRIHYAGAGTLTLSGNNTTSELLISNNASMVIAGSVGAFGTGTVANNEGAINFNNLNVTASVITGIVERSRITGAQNYTGTVHVKTENTLVGYDGPNQAFNGPFSKAHHVISAPSSLQYVTSGDITLENSFAGLQIYHPTAARFEVGSVTVNQGTIYTAYGALHTLSVNGDLTLNDDYGLYTPFEGGIDRQGGSFIEFKSDGTTTSNIEVSGTAYLAGNLGFYFLDGVSAPETSMTYNLITAENYEGYFETIFLPTLAEGWAWDISKLNTEGSIAITAIPEPATFAALAGILSLSLAHMRRRRASK